MVSRDHTYVSTRYQETVHKGQLSRSQLKATKSTAGEGGTHPPASRQGLELAGRPGGGAALTIECRHSPVTQTPQVQTTRERGGGGMREHRHPPTPLGSSTSEGRHRHPPTPNWAPQDQEWGPQVKKRRDICTPPQGQQWGPQPQSQEGRGETDVPPQGSTNPAVRTTSEEEKGEVRHIYAPLHKASSEDHNHNHKKGEGNRR